jgi:Uma2 family endonuclease
MNQALKIPTPISSENYLEGEKHSEIRHEFISGEIFAMAGESKIHNIIVLNLAVQLRNHLRDQPPGRVFMENVKTQVKKAQEERYYYPDLQVSCENSVLQEYYESDPKLIIEVLSPSTERFDRADKFYAYRKLTSLKEYVLVAQDTPRVEIYRRATQWELELYTDLKITIKLDSIQFKGTLTDIYEGVPFESQGRMR